LDNKYLFFYIREGYLVLKMIVLLRKNLAVRLVAVIMAAMLILSVGIIVLEIKNSRSAAKEAISGYGMRLAESYAKQFDTGKYEEFLKNPQENELYWAIRAELDRFRTQAGVLYVYTVALDGNKTPRLLIDGQPKDSDSASPINEVTDMPPDTIDAVWKGENASTPLIENPEYGTYISTYAPIKNASGTIIGALGIDTETGIIDQISSDVLRGSIPFYIIMFAATVVLVALIALFIIRALRPLRYVVKSAESIAAGDLAQASQLLASHPVKSADEIGAAYKAMVRMSENLHSIVGRMVSSVAQTSGQLVASSDSFTEEASQMLVLNEKVNASIQQVAEGARTQHISADESAKSLEEMAISIQRISEASTTVSDASQQALEEAEKGKQMLGRMDHQVQTIASVAEETLQRVTVLNGYSNEIGQVVRSIVEIANQTKLLALNASIEAARAGEHGSGFAVVAGEVRKLADSSSASAVHIATLLNNIQTEAERIHEKMNDGTREITEGVVLSERVEASFASILERFKFVTDQIQDISAATEEMSAGSEEVAASVGDIVDIAKAAAERMQLISELTNKQLGGAKEIAESAMKLSETSHEMRQTIEQFKV
jgi:methyl-accepting chemotaxis protein